MWFTATRQKKDLFHDFSPGRELIDCSLSYLIEHLLDRLLDFTPETPTSVDLPPKSRCFGSRLPLHHFVPKGGGPQAIPHHFSLAHEYTLALVNDFNRIQLSSTVTAIASFESYAH